MAENQKEDVHVLQQVGIKVLEDWAMMLVEQSSAKESNLSSELPIYASSMHFEGVIAGKVSILAQLPFLQTLARNLLGIDSDQTPSISESEDAFKEMANVILGNYLTEAYGPDTPFVLTNPQVEQKQTFSEFADKIGPQVFYLTADGFTVILTFRVDG